MMERDIAAWKDYLCTHGELSEEDIVELEDHLRSLIADLQEKGLSDEEAFIIGVRRTGKVSKVAAEFSKVQRNALWKQLFAEPAGPADLSRSRREAILVVVLALLAGALSRIPEIFGIELLGEGMYFYIRNLSFLILPAAVCYLVWKYPSRSIQAIIFSALALGSAVLANVYPAYATGSFDILIGIHVPMLMWLAAGVVYSGPGWRSADGRMDFVRFSGETFIYLILIFCGGAVLLGTAHLLFGAIELNADTFLLKYVAVIGGCAAPIVAVYLASSKKNVIENMAPVLARIFSPLFLVLMVTFIVVMTSTGSVLTVERDILIGFDLLLALVLGMVLYTVSARDEKRPPGLNDYLQAGLILSALVVDTIALVAVTARIWDYGFTPNKTAALGENVLLLINLAVSGALYFRFFKNKEGFRLLTLWQTRFLPVYAVWAAAVAFLFPVIFK
jgi:hypothetical protein